MAIKDILSLESNRGVKMTLLGASAMVIVRVGCYYAGLPDTLGQELMWSIGGLFGVQVGAQKLADGMSKGATATVKSDAISK